MILPSSPSNALLAHLRAPRFQWEAQDSLTLEDGLRLGHSREGEKERIFSAAWVVAAPGGEVRRVGWQCHRTPARVPLFSILCSALMDEVDSPAGLTLERLVNLELGSVQGASGMIPRERWDEANAVLRLLQQAAHRCQTGLETSQVGGEPPLCHCWGVSRAELETFLRAGKPLSQAQRVLGVGSSCGGCWPAVLECLSDLERESGG